MEFMIMLASGAMSETMELILYRLPPYAILGFADLAFRPIAGRRVRQSLPL